MRYIEYNPNFIQKLKSDAGTNWSVYSVLAHEIGHHLQGHTLTNTGSRPSIELQADEYSGFILAKLGASINDAEVAMQVFGSPQGSPTHPARNQRLAAIKEGWTKGKKLAGQVGDMPKIEGPKKEGDCSIEDIFQLTNKGSSKEDILKKCKDVIDGEECNIRKIIRLAQQGKSTKKIERSCESVAVVMDEPQNSSSTLASNICQTRFMWCALPQYGQVGTPCWCNTFVGPSHGRLIPSRQ
jgi:hypothetical protein